MTLVRYDINEINCEKAVQLASRVRGIARDKAAYCVFTQVRGPENAIKLISVRTKTQ